MTIAFDAKRFCSNAAGLGNYSRFIIEALGQANPNLELLLCSPSAGRPELYRSVLDALPNAQLLLPEGLIKGSLWRNYGLLKELPKHQCKLFHGLSHELPLGLKPGSMATAVTMHDLIYEKMPHLYKYIDRKLYAWKYKSAARRADLVIAISEQTKRDLIELYQIDASKIRVIYQGCAPQYGLATDADEELARSTYFLPKKYMLFVGSIEERKNLKLCVDALAASGQEELHLVAIGRATPFCQEVKARARELKIDKRVHLLHGLPFKHLPGIYRGAELFAYPSRYEGFGIPILEAIRSSVPVIAATGSCLEEAGGPDSLYTDPDDAEMMATMIQRICNDRSLRKQMIERSLKYAERFQPAAIAQDLFEAYSSIL